MPLRGKNQTHNCFIWLKLNHWESCPAKNIVCNNCSGRGHFANYCKKATVNQIDDSYDFNQLETNVIHRLERQKDKEEFGVFAKRTGCGIRQEKKIRSC